MPAASRTRRGSASTSAPPSRRACTRCSPKRPCSPHPRRRPLRRRRRSSADPARLRTARRSAAAEAVRPRCGRPSAHTGSSCGGGCCSPPPRRRRRRRAQGAHPRLARRRSRRLRCMARSGWNCTTWRPKTSARCYSSARARAGRAEVDGGGRQRCWRPPSTRVRACAYAGRYTRPSIRWCCGARPPRSVRRCSTGGWSRRACAPAIAPQRPKLQLESAPSSLRARRLHGGQVVRRL